MAIISQETWDKFTQEEKDKVIKDYNNSAVSVRIRLEAYFGKHNLQPKPKSPKTWNDVEDSEKFLNVTYDRRHTHLTLDNNIVNTKVINKIIASYKIAYLISKCYGGIVTKEEWRDANLFKWYIVIGIEGKLVIDSSYENWQEFVSFHTQQQAEEFMSYPENVELVKQYYMS